MFMARSSRGRMLRPVGQWWRTTLPRSARGRTIRPVGQRSRASPPISTVAAATATARSLLSTSTPRTPTTLASAAPSSPSCRPSRTPSQPVSHPSPPSAQPPPQPAAPPLLPSLPSRLPLPMAPVLPEPTPRRLLSPPPRAPRCQEKISAVSVRCRTTLPRTRPPPAGPLLPRKRPVMQMDRVASARPKKRACVSHVVSKGGQSARCRPMRLPTGPPSVNVTFSRKRPMTQTRLATSSRPALRARACHTVSTGGEARRASADVCTLPCPALERSGAGEAATLLPIPNRIAPRLASGTFAMAAPGLAITAASNGYMHCTRCKRWEARRGAPAGPCTACGVGLLHDGTSTVHVKTNVHTDVGDPNAGAKPHTKV